MVSDGSHTLLAVARDASGNVATSSPISITVSNPVAVEESSSGHSRGSVRNTSPATGTGNVAASALTSLIQDNRTLFLAAQAQGIELPAFVLKMLGLATPASFSRNLTLGSDGEDVRALQTLLISKGYQIPAGATGYFGIQTRTALAAYQRANGITPAAGYFGEKTRGVLGK